MGSALQALTGLIVALSACYFFGMVLLGVRASRERGAALNSQAFVAYDDPYLGLGVDDTGATVLPAPLYFLIPCLDEELVIGTTVGCLARGAAAGTIIVIDDASDDATGQVARAAGGSEVTVVRRELPAARAGKGPALNAGYAELVRVVEERGQDPAEVIVCVMDADGRLSDGALAATLTLFDDPAVGGAQLAVRIRNRHSWLTQFQDFQFWTMSAVTQLGRVRTGTVSLGGNGQFTRLSALAELGPAPWSASLTEDLDLTISLIIRGWRCTSTPHASVDQQGIETIRRLLNQRTRWYQGHMTAGRRIPEVWRSTRIRHRAAVETIMYLLVPWVLDLPWSILYHVAIFRFSQRAADGPLVAGGRSVLGLPLVYLVAFTPAILTGVLCRRRDPRTSWPRAMLLGHSFMVMNYLSWACTWRAVQRIVRGRSGWEKTVRHAEAPSGGPSPGLVAADGPADRATRPMERGRTGPADRADPLDRAG